MDRIDIWEMDMCRNVPCYHPLKACDTCEKRRQQDWFPFKTGVLQRKHFRPNESGDLGRYFSKYAYPTNSKMLATGILKNITNMLSSDKKMADDDNYQRAMMHLYSALDILKRYR